MKKYQIKNSLIFFVFMLFILSSLTPMVFGNTSASSESSQISDLDRQLEDLAYYCMTPNGLNEQKYNHYRELLMEQYSKDDNYNSDVVELKNTIVQSETKSASLSFGPMDSPWPMYSHDTRHTGRSPYNTINTWEQIWTFKQHKNYYVLGSPVIDKDGIIYFGGLGDFYALYPNGTIKWESDVLDFYVWSAPAIDEDGTIYVGDCHGYFHAISPNGTLKWKFKTSHELRSSPAIGNDGTIYFGDADYYINAVYSNNGTMRWRYKTGLVVYSSPAIGDDGTVYCGSHDNYLYALYPNNGTLKWKYGTGNWIRTSPCIADDGTIYFVSLDGYLRALYPNGTLKWQTDVGAGTSPTIGQDGTIYAGYGTLHAVDPMDGSVKWTLDIDGNIKGSTPCNSIEGTIYFGTDSAWLYAVNSDGTLKWKEKISNEFIDSAPAIAEDGTLYVGSASFEGGYTYGHLHAFGVGELEADANGPYYGLINQAVHFTGTSSGGYSPHSYHWDFGDTYTSEEQNPTHMYTTAGTYTVNLTVTDSSDNVTSDITWAKIKESNNPPNKPDISGPTHGKPATSYDYTFVATDPDDDEFVFYHIDWDDGSNTGWFGPYIPGENIIQSHSWNEENTYTIKCKAKDNYGTESDWGTLDISIPRNRIFNQDFFLQFLESHPNIFPLIRFLLKL